MTRLYYHFDVSGEDFTQAGSASMSIKDILRKLELSPELIRRVCIAVYEGEINMVIHGGGGHVDMWISPEVVEVVLTDDGPGIHDVDSALKEGWTTATDDIRNMGFGAGMGLPNMKKYADLLSIHSRVGEGTVVTVKVWLGREQPLPEGFEERLTALQNEQAAAGKGVGTP